MAELKYSFEKLEVYVKAREFQKKDLLAPKDITS
jgi:hypothetical protein